MPAHLSLLFSIMPDKYSLSYFFPLAISFFLIGCAPTHLLRCRDQQTVEAKSFADELSKREVVCIGEVHSEYRHHEDQLELIRNLHDSGVDLALGLEMFSFTNQEMLDRWNQGSLDWQSFAQMYSQNWNVPFGMYEAIFLYAREKHIPLVGLNLPSMLANKVARQGFSSLTSPELQNLPESVSCKQDSAQTRLLRQMLTAHGADESSVNNFCEAQTLRDKTMALKTYQYQKQSPHKTVLVLAGIGHCLKQGMVEHLETISGKSAVVILPAVSGQILGKTITTEDADYVLP